MNAANIIAIGILILIILLITFPFMARLKSNETCCGSEKVKIKRKKIKNPIGHYMLSVSGMHCKNCKKSVMDTINGFNGLSCIVSLEKKEAVIFYENDPMTEDVIKALGNLGFYANIIDAD